MTTSTTALGKGAGDLSTVGETAQTTGTAAAAAGDIDQYGKQVAGESPKKAGAGASIDAASLTAVGAAGIKSESYYVTAGNEVCLCMFARVV